MSKQNADRSRPRTGTGACPYKPQSSPLEIEPQSPAIAVRPEIRDGGIVRAARESDFSRTGWSRYERTGGFPMATNDGSRTKKANSSSPDGIEPREVGRRAHGFRNEGNANNPIFDKFPTKFDKFLKNNIPVSSCYKKNKMYNLSVVHSNIATKKYFRFSRIFPQLARICARGRDGERGSQKPLVWFIGQRMLPPKPPNAA